MISGLIFSLAASAMHPVEVTIPGPEGELAGTFVHANDDGPAMILIPGSGPTDRNGDNPGGVRGGVYRQLADGLAAHGINTLLIDKRGMFGSGDSVANANAVTFDDYVADVRGWMGLLAERGKECVWVGGHSEGVMVSIMAAQDPSGICGLVLVSGAGEPILDVLVKQLSAQLPPAMLEQVEAGVAEMKAGRTFDPAGLPGPLAAMFSEDLQRFMISGYAPDPKALLANVDLPVLIVHGEEDIQVGTDQAEALASASTNARLVILDRVNHALKPVKPGDRLANVKTYGDADLKIDPRIADAIADFVQGAGE